MQERFIKFKDGITSLGANAKISGIIAAGRYRGFDKPSNISGLSFDIDHTLSGEEYTTQDLIITPPKGSWVTRQGVTIKETAPLPFTLVTNAGNGANRIDFLIGKHYHDIIAPGGLNATYEILRGPLNSNNVEPTITTDAEQVVILGKFYIPANASSMTDVVYIPNRAATLGGEIPALLNKDNRSTAQQQDAQSSNVTVITADYELVARGVILALNAGNTFKAEDGLNHLDLLPNKPNGTEINIHFIKPITLINFTEQLVDPVNGNSTRAGYTIGLRPILISETLGKSINVKAQQIVKFVKVDVGGAYSNVPGSTNYIWGECWKVISISDSPERVKDLETLTTAQQTAITTLNTQVTNILNLINNINPPRSLKWIDYQGNYPDDFDANGKALSTSPYYGYHEANGNGGTPNMRGRMAVHYDPSQFEFSAIGFVGGLKVVPLSIANLAPFRFGFNTKLSQYQSWNRSSGSDRPVVGVGGINGNVGGNDYLGYTETLGSNVSHENMPPYRVTMCLMWIGIPTP